MKHSSIVKSLGFCILVIVFNLSHLIRKRGEKFIFPVHYNADVYAYSLWLTWNEWTLLIASTHNGIYCFADN